MEYIVCLSTDAPVPQHHHVRRDEPMNDGLIDGFRHNTWATNQVLQACAQLTEDQLSTTVTGTYGSVIATLRHMVSSEGGYCRRLTGDEPDWYPSRDNEPDIAELSRRVDDLAARWERFLAPSRSTPSGCS